MQITSNTTSMEAGLCLAPDKEGKDYCVVVVKGTFAVDNEGNAVLAEEQEPLVYADLHYGDPGTTSIRYECDFARFKPRADIIVNGHAYSPTGRPVPELQVALEFRSLKKIVRVVGDREWQQRLVGAKPTHPDPFSKMPLLFERAFGGSDHSHKKEKYKGTESRNPLGAGYHLNSDPKSLVGKALPNMENPRELYKKWSDTPAPTGFGVVGRGWQPRISHAGTYDEQWLEDRYPFLPEDFNELYFQSAPEDQQVPFLQGGEAIRCVNMAPKTTFVAEVPKIDLPITFKFRDRSTEARPNLDTVVVEPDRGRLLLTWRICQPLGRKLHALLEVAVGRPEPRSIPRSSKPRFKGIHEYIESKTKKEP